MTLCSEGGGKVFPETVSTYTTDGPDAPDTLPSSVPATETAATVVVSRNANSKVRVMILLLVANIQHLADEIAVAVYLAIFPRLPSLATLDLSPCCRTGKPRM